MTLKFFFRHLRLLHAMLYHPRFNGSRVTCYAYRLFTQGGFPRMGYRYGFIHGKNPLHSLFRFVWGITSQGQLPFIGWARASCPACLKQTLLRSWLLSEHLGQVSWSSGHPMAIYVTFGASLLRVHTPHSVPKIYANGLLSYELTIPYLIQLVPCLADEFVGRPRSLPVLIARDCGEIRGRVLRIESWVNTSSMRNFSSIGLALPNKAGVVFLGMPLLFT